MAELDDCETGSERRIRFVFLKSLCSREGVVVYSPAIVYLPEIGCNGRKVLCV